MKKLILLILVAICSQVYGQRIVIERILKADTLVYIHSPMNDIAFDFWVWDDLDKIERQWILECCAVCRPCIIDHDLLSLNDKKQVIIEYRTIKECVEEKREIEKTKQSISILLNLYDCYAKECYADSTEVPETYYIGSDGWEHRNPTLPGFIEFLKKTNK